MTTDLASRLQAALDALPDTAEEIAAMLRDEGIRGLPACSSLCPLAVWLSRQCHANVIVGPCAAYIGGPPESLVDRSFPLPDAAYDFVRWFDAEGRPGGECSEMVTR